jgi:high affinity sulfate transporter 1
MSVAGLVKDRIPALVWIPEYNRDWLRPDLVAGVTTASVIIPKAMAYATVAGVAVQMGLYTALLPMAAYAFLGSFRRLSVSTSTTIGILTAAAIAEAAPNATAAQAALTTTTLAFLVGVALGFAAILRLGFLADFISEPVLTGFKAGIGIVIIADQLPKLFGLHIPHGHLVPSLMKLIEALPETSLVTLALATATIAIMLALEHWVPRAPAPLIVVAGGVLASSALGLAARGVSTVGSIPAGFPGVTLPDAGLLKVLWPEALGVALISFTESIAAGRAFMKAGEPQPQANQELLALGIGNMLGGLTGAMPSGGGTSQTAVNAGAGARSPVASLVTVASTIVVLLFLSGLIGLMPQATLASVVIVTSVGLISVADFRAIRQVRTQEFRWALTAMLGVIVLGTLQGIVAAVVLSLVNLLWQANDPPVHVLARKPGTDVFRPRTAEHPDDEAFGDVLVLRTEGRIYFANAQRIAEKIAALVDAQKPRVVVLDLSAVPDIEYTGLKALSGLESSLQRAGCRLQLAALNPAALTVVQRSPLGEVLGRDRMSFTVQQALSTASRSPV